MSTRNILIVLLAVMIAACVETSRPEATGKGNIRSLNSAVTTPELDFLLEERFLQKVIFQGVSVAESFDDLPYIVNFDYRYPVDIESTRLISMPFDLVADNDHLFVFTGDLANPGMIYWERPLREWSGTETVLEMEYAHLSPQLAEVDMYLDVPGTAPVMGSAVASLSNGNRSTVTEIASGEYEFIVTSKDDPDDILFQSEPVTLAPAQTFMITLFDTDISVNTPINVRMISGDGSASIALADINSPPTIRNYHASFETGPTDIYRDQDFSTPFIDNQSFGDLSAPVESARSVTTYSYTDAGNPGAILLERDLALAASRQATLFLVGDSTVLLNIVQGDDYRPIEAYGKVRFTHTAINHIAIDIYMVDTGANLEDAVAPRVFGLPTFNDSNYLNLEEKVYDVYVTTAGDREDILAGPHTLDLALGDTVHFAILDNVDPSILDLDEYDHTSAP